MTACDRPMETRGAIDLLFADMDKLGPGDDEQTLYVLRSLPRHRFDLVVDAGCGVGRQTFVLARELETDIYAVDSHQPFLDRLNQRAEQNSLAHLVHAHCMDMTDIPYVFPSIDLLWSEGAAYNIGFVNALTRWAEAINPRGFAVVSELCWLRNPVPNSVREFFRFGYPDMKSVPENIEIAERAGYEIFNIYTLPEKAWIEDYYEILGSRAKWLIKHADVAVRDLAVETINRGLQMFERNLRLRLLSSATNEIRLANVNPSLNCVTRQVPAGLALRALPAVACLILVRPIYGQRHGSLRRAPAAGRA